MTIEEQLAIVKGVLEKCEAATPGPWFAEEVLKDGLTLIDDGRSAALFSIPAEAHEADSIVALHNHAPTALEGWVRAVEHCKAGQYATNPPLVMPNAEAQRGYRMACRVILALLTTSEESNDVD